MRLARFSDSKTESYGVMQEGHVICLPTLAHRLKPRQSIAPTLPEFIAHQTTAADVDQLVRNASQADLQRASYQLAHVKLLAPIARPPKIICLGLNYRDHAAEQAKTPPDEPLLFLKPHTTIIGPDERILQPAFVNQLDYEAELAIVIGRPTKNVSVQTAGQSIFGYTILNDISARDIQARDRQWTRAKSFDTFAPTGPCITTADSIADPTKLPIRTWVNHELRQNSTTHNMVFNVYQIVHHLSRCMTLEPCDLIATGTPAGVGFAMKPEPKFLADGDVIEMEIPGIGVLRNTVTQDPSGLHG
jgi:2-keto-4-pentenoate hydratase/2-oxohepta-3-ene-1,7-dioic acid hydratase in catechol pathway